jgi:hypothetical protein
MFIYREFDYNKYTFDKIKFGINLAKNTIKLKHTYTGPDRIKHNTIITEPQEIVEFLEHLLALSQPAQDETDEQRIKKIEPLLNQMYGYTKSAKVKPDDTFLSVGMTVRFLSNIDLLPCPCGQKHDHCKIGIIGIIGNAGKNFTTGEEKLELRQECPESNANLMLEEDFLITYTQNTLNLNSVPEQYKAIWQPQYYKAKRI